MSSPVLTPPDITSGVFRDTPAAASDIAVSVRGLSKSYSIARNAEKHSTLGEMLMHKLRNPLLKAERDTFWALNDVNFDIQKGDVVGIIGRNGAGKSTLLKILSRITEPTRGRIDLYGRVGSLLEVGTGFHPELTGRENIFLNGAILGMQKSEIARQFEAIVDFSGTEQFLDTPVKRYSSGMYVRLAFAVAAHLNPEILIVDEVLAVGDAEFQKKCLGKMHDVAVSGRTVLFVSHNMSTVLQLCRHAVFLDQGRLLGHDTAENMVNTYVAGGSQGNAEFCWEAEKAPHDETVSIQSVRILDCRGDLTDTHLLTSPISLEIDYRCYQENVRLNPSFHVTNAHGVCVFATSNDHDEDSGRKRYRPGLYRARCEIPAHLLNDGQYTVSAFVVKDVSQVLVHAKDALTFHVLDDGSTRGDYTGGWIGAVRPLLPWQVKTLKNEARA